MYSRNRQVPLLLEVLGKGLVIAGFTFVMNLLWNYVAPVWGLPVMGFLHFAVSVILFNLIIGFIASYFQPNIVMGQQDINFDDMFKDLNG
jgi:uncharacterized membrane protein (DUF106 family)